jgi:hypothetical protein
MLCALSLNVIEKKGKKKLAVNFLNLPLIYNFTIVTSNPLAVFLACEINVAAPWL